MPRSKIEKRCKCGADDCREMTYSNFYSGHDSKMLSALKEACGGSILDMRSIVEDALGKKIRFKLGS